MKISIIIPVYNVAQYIVQCIKSVLSQDYEDIEIIIVDDCSTDDSMELVKKMISGTPRTVYLLEHSTNRGASAARNTGIGQATGDYIYFLDSDDYIELDCISSLVKVAQRYPVADMIYGSFKVVLKGQIVGDIAGRTDLKEYYDDRRQIKKLILDSAHFPCSVCNILIKREWMLRYDLYFREGIIFEDLHWTFYAVKNVESIALLKKTTYYYRRNSNGVSMSTQIQKRTDSARIIIKDWACHLDFQCLFAQLYAILHFAYICYLTDYGGDKRPRWVQMFYPIIYIPILFCRKTRKSHH